MVADLMFVVVVMLVGSLASVWWSGDFGSGDEVIAGTHWQAWGFIFKCFFSIFPVSAVGVHR